MENKNTLNTEIGINFTHDESVFTSPEHVQLKITDKRDLAEIRRRKGLKLCQPLRNELYSFNPNFDGNYTY